MKPASSARPISPERIQPSAVFVSAVASGRLRYPRMAWAERNQISPLSPGLTSSSVTGSTTRASTPGKGSPPEASRSGWAASRCASAVSKVATPDSSVIP